MEKFFYYAGCLAAISLLSSLPRFLFEVKEPFFILDRLLVLVLFLLATWFFRTSLNAPFQFSIISSMFFIEVIASVCFAFLLFFQFFSPWFALISAILILAKIAAYSYLSIDRLKNLRGLVYTTVFTILLLGEVIITFGLRFM